MTLLDEDGDPTDEFLNYLRTVKPICYKDVMEVVENIRKAWWCADRQFVLKKPYKGKRRLELHTGGWSNNESIVYAIKENMYLTNFLMRYTMWKTGGHHYFEIKTHV